MKLNPLTACTMFSVAMGFLIGCEDSEKLLAAKEVQARTTEQSSQAEFVGSEQCVACHQQQGALWKKSHHHHAMAVASEETVFGDFNNRDFEYFGRKSHFYKRGKQFLVDTENQQGTMETFAVSHTLGFMPLQQYLVTFADGRVQTLPFSWDSRPVEEGGQRWFHIYPNENIKADNPLFWTRPQQNWNHMCADCHTTNYQKNFSTESNTFNSQWSELGNGCESCHGPGQRHIEIVNNNKSGKPTDLGIKKLINQEQQIHLCGVCHARRERLKENHQQETMMSTWRPELLQQGLYFHDGKIRDEVFVTGSFLQSKMYQAGVTCSNCHDAHSGKTKVEGNKLCLQCHAAETFDNTNHHKHPSESVGSYCVNCHMPARTYMEVDPRRDHSFSIPNSDLSQLIDSFDVCTDCHDNQGEKTATKIKQLAQVAFDHFGLAFWQARTEKVAARESLLRVIQSKDHSSIIRSTALQELGMYLSEDDLSLIKTQLQSGDALIRYGAIQALLALAPEQRLPLLLQHLDDSSLAVRHAIARLLVGINNQGLTSGQKQSLLKLEREYELWLEANSDRASALVELAGLYLAKGDVLKAQRYYDMALVRDETSLAARLNYADYYRALGNEGEAEKHLRKALEIYPDSADVHFALGLLLVRNQQTEGALGELQQALALMPENSRYHYVYGVGLYSSGRKEEALEVLNRAKTLFPANQAIQSALRAYESGL